MAQTDKVAFQLISELRNVSLGIFSDTKKKSFEKNRLFAKINMSAGQIKSSRYELRKRYNSGDLILAEIELRKIESVSTRAIREIKNWNAGESSRYALELVNAIGKFFLAGASVKVPKSQYNKYELQGYIDKFRLILEICKQIRDVLSKEMKEYPLGEFNHTPEVLLVKAAEIVPGQNIGPIQFDILDGNLYVRRQKSDPLPEDAKNVDVARSTLTRQCQRILDRLHKANFGGTLIEPVTDLLELLDSKTDVVALGLQNITLDALAQSQADELSDALLAMLSAFSLSMSLYVAQFPEWSKFREKALRTHLDPDDTQKIWAISAQLADDLEAANGVADMAVPRSIRAIVVAGQTNPEVTKIALAALMATQENLVAKVFDTAIDFMQGALKGVATATSGRVPAGVAILLNLALKAAVEAAPILSRAVNVQWMSEARILILEILERQHADKSDEP